MGFGFKIFKMKKYSVLFEHRNTSMSVTIAHDLCIEDAVQFALNLHRSSNTEHVIFVCSMVDRNNVALELSKS